MTSITDIKRKFQEILGFQHLSLRQITPSRVRNVLQNQSSTLMQAVALETTGKEFWIAVDAALDRIKANRSADIRQPLASIPSWAEIQKAKEAERLANPTALNHWLHDTEGACCGIPQPINKGYTAEQIRDYLDGSDVGREVILVERGNCKYEFVWSGGYKSGILNNVGLSDYFQECIIEGESGKLSCPVRVKEISAVAKVVAQTSLMKIYRDTQKTLKSLRDDYNVSLTVSLTSDLKTLQRELIRISQV